MKQSADALFAKTEDGIMPVMLEETHTYKKLLLSWNKGTQGERVENMCSVPVLKNYVFFELFAQKSVELVLEFIALELA